MRTIADHIYDIANNSIKAKAKNIALLIEESDDEKIVKFSIKDDGSGIPEDKLKDIFDPFFTTRDKKIRKVGLGIPLLKQNTELTGGKILIESRYGEGTYIEALFKTDSIDMIEAGDIGGTITGLITADIDINWKISLVGIKGEENITTDELKEVLDGIPINNIQVIPMIKEIMKNMCDSVFQII